MARLPQPGGDDGDWGDILNDYLSQAHKTDGHLKDNSVTSNTIAPNSVTNAAIASNAINAALIADGSITEVLLAPAVQTKLNAGASTPSWSDITGKPTVIAAGADQAAARSAIGAGTSDLVIGTTATTAKAGNYSPTKSDVGLANVDNTSDTAKNSATATLTNKTIDGGDNTLQNIPQSAVTGLSTSLSAKLNTTTAASTYAPLASPTFTGTVTVPTPAGNTDAATKAYVDSTVSTSAPVTSVAGHTGAVTLAKSDVGLTNVDNTSDLNKPISTATQTALNDKADLVSGKIPTAQLPAIALMDVVTVADQAAMLALTTAQVQPGDIAVRTDGAGTFVLTAANPATLANWTKLNAPTDTVTSVNGHVGTVVLAKSDVGLANVDNTSDLNKPISTAAQTALDAKADLVGGKITSAQLPSLAITDVVTAANQTAMLAFTSAQVQKGDVAIRTDGAGSFILTDDDPSVLTNWTLLSSPTDAVTSVSGKTGTVTLVKSDVGLDNVDNTSDTIKNSATATLTNKTIDGGSNTLQNIPQGAVTGLSSALATITTRTVLTLTTVDTLAAAASTDYIVFLGSGAAPTLPTAVGNTNKYTLKNIHTENITILTTSSQTIDGSTTAVIVPNQSIDVISDGTNWRII